MSTFFSCYTTIGIAKSTVDDRCINISIFSKELGHHFTTLDDLTVKSTTYPKKLKKNKKEIKAKLWTADFLLVVAILYNL